MTRRPLLALVMAVASLAGAACGGDPETAEPKGKDLPDIVDRSLATPRTFSYVQRVRAGTFRVDGAVEDDYRYRADYRAADGSPGLTEVVVDDDRFLQFRSTLFRDAIARAEPAVGQVPVGEWRQDTGGSPPEFGKTDQPQSALPPAETLDKVRFLDEIDDLTAKGLLSKWNKNSSSYLEKNDKFPRHEADGVRFDVLPVPYDADVAFKDGVPVDLRDALQRYFQYSSIWVRDGRVTRVEILFDPPDLTKTLTRVQRLFAERQGLRFDPRLVPPTPVRTAISYVVRYPRPRPVVTRPQATGALDLPRHAPSQPGGATVPVRVEGSGG